MGVPERYRQWVDYHYPTLEEAKNQCAQATALMVKEFPELKRVGGYFYHPHTTLPIQHWWCVTEYGDIVDPTYRQFGVRGAIDKVHYDQMDPLPTGRCLECGSLTFNQEGMTSFCNKDCERSFLHSLT